MAGHAQEEAQVDTAVRVQKRQGRQGPLQDRHRQTLNLLFKKLFQSSLSLFEIFLINYVIVSINNQLGFTEFIFLEKTHVS